MTVFLDTTDKSGYVIEDIYATLSNGTTKQLNAEVFVDGPRVASLDFGDMLRGEDGKSRSFMLGWPDGNQLEIKSISYDAEWLEVTHQSDPKNCVEKFSVSPAKNVPFGVLAKEITIKTNDPLMEWKSVSVTGTVLYPVAVDPPQALMGEFYVGEKKPVSIRVFSPYDLPLLIDKTEVVEGKAPEWSYTAMSPTEQRLDLIVDEADYRGERIMKLVMRITARVGGEPHQITVDAYGLRSREDVEQAI